MKSYFWKKSEMAQTEINSLDRQKSAQKAEAILEGAMQEFLVHGYAATSMDRVAAAAGVSKATVYSHFQDKEGLFTALIQRLVRERCRVIFSSQDSQLLQGEPSIVLRRLATNMLDEIVSDPQLLAFMRLIIGESGRFPELARVFVRNLDKPVIEVLSQYLASRSELKLPNPEAAARVFIGTLVHFVIIQEMLHGKDILPMERDRLIDNLIYLIAVT
jgi:AcrR family transcriptional regulator